DSRLVFLSATSLILDKFYPFLIEAGFFHLSTSSLLWVYWPCGLSWNPWIKLLLSQAPCSLGGVRLLIYSLKKNLKAWSGYNQVAIMEKELANLSLGEEEEEGVQFELEGQPQTSKYDLCLVGRCLTASVVDLERVMSGIPWTFNNHLILLHKLKVGEDPTSTPLIYSDFWVHVHDLPSGYSSDQVAKQLGNFV
ncbi:hypothetical protein Goari_002470, partial [Gossypium aridum]|nr:hypothetical protein [Gossypium aridum]